MAPNRLQALVVLVVAGVGLCKEVSRGDASLIPFCSELWKPFILSAYPLPNKAMKISWHLPEFQNDLITFSLNISACTEPKETVVDMNNSTVYFAVRLTPWTDYNITLNAFNDSSLTCLDTTTVRTLMTEPNEPSTLTSTFYNSSSIEVHWESPSEPNGNLKGYIVIWTDNHSSGEMNTSNTFAILNGLNFETKYTISVAAYNEQSSVILVGKSKTISVSTDSGVPSNITSLSSDQVTNSTVHISWNPPKFPNGRHPQYTVTWQKHNSKPKSSDPMEKLDYEIENMSSGEEYTIMVEACNIGRLGRYCGGISSIQVSTYNIAPDVVENLSVKEISDTSVTFQWKEPKTKNGPISGYIISYDGKKEITTTDMFYTVRNLKPWTFCAISVRAFNVDSVSGTKRLEGPKAVHNETTFASTPGIVQNLFVREKSNSSLTIQWQEPKTKNGPLSGYIISDHEEIEIRTADTIFTLRGLRPWTPYTVSVKAYNVDTRNETNILEGPPQYVNVRTSASAPPLPKEIKLSHSTETEIIFILPKLTFSSINGPIIDYVILVDSGNTLEKSSQLSYETNQKPSNNWKESQNVKQIYRSSPTGWTPEEENDICKKVNDVLICTIGSQKNCENVYFCNGPLRKETTYRIKVRGYTEAGWSETNAIETATGSGRSSSSKRLSIHFELLAKLLTSIES